MPRVIDFRGGLVIELIATLEHFGNQALGFRVQLGTTSAKAKKSRSNALFFFLFFFAFFANLLMYIADIVLH